MYFYLFRPNSTRQQSKIQVLAEDEWRSVKGGITFLKTNIFSYLLNLLFACTHQEKIIIAVFRNIFSCQFQTMCFLSAAQSDRPVMSCCQGFYSSSVSWSISLLAMSGSYAECSEMFPLFPPFPSASNPCEKNDGRGPCSHLCLINYNRTASCTCPHLMKLSPNKQSCFSKPEHPPHFSCSFLYVIKVILYHTM